MAENQENVETSYTAKDLAVLEGLEAVRKRPGMYIGSTDSRGLMHCLWEIIDNAVDEALGGHCKTIEINLAADGSIEVHDDGRGIPVDKEPKTGLTGVEVVMTKLHAGGKFGSGSYAASGGLHGVGASVVNALSSRLDVEVDRGGKITWHGPGQLVGYPIARLPEPIDVVAYVRWLEQVLIDLTASFGLHTERVEGRTGIWAPTPDGHVKIGAIGIRVAERVTMHGFALNCNNSLAPYETIIACGIKDAATSTLAELTGKDITTAMAAEVVMRHLKEISKVEL